MHQWSHISREDENSQFSLPATVGGNTFGAERTQPFEGSPLLVEQL